MNAGAGAQVIHNGKRQSPPLYAYTSQIKLVAVSFLVGVGVVLVGYLIQPDKWSSWTECSVTCGNGKQYRVKQQQDKDKFEVKSCAAKQCIDDDVLLDMKFDRYSLHSSRFLSYNDKVVGSHNTYETTIHGSGDNRLKKYKGVVTDFCIQNNTAIYYTVRYQYHITSTLDGAWLMLELGIAERDKIDKYHYVGSADVNGWSFYLNNCMSYKKLCMKAAKKSSIKYTSEFSDNSAGTTAQGKFDVMIDRIKNTFTLWHNHKLFYRFQNVTSDFNLCPVFGMYNPEDIDVKIQIINSYNLTNLPSP